MLINLYNKYKAVFFLSNSKNLNNNLADKELAAIKSLRNNQDLKETYLKELKEFKEPQEKLFNQDLVMLCKPDKGTGVVVCNKKEYIAKMNVILNHQLKFKNMDSDNRLPNLTRF